MRNYRRSSHCVYDIKYHLVWITKYRKPILYGSEAERVREITRQVCAGLDVEIVQGHVSRDHVHLLVSVPPSLSVSKLVQGIKGKTSRKLLSESRRINKACWGKHLWARGYFAASSGNVTDEAIAHYIAHQDENERFRDDNFRVGG